MISKKVDKKEHAISESVRTSKKVESKTDLVWEHVPDDEIQTTGVVEDTLIMDVEPQMEEKIYVKDMTMRKPMGTNSDLDRQNHSDPIAKDSHKDEGEGGKNSEDILQNMDTDKYQVGKDSNKNKAETQKEVREADPNPFEEWSKAKGAEEDNKNSTANTTSIKGSSINTRREAKSIQTKYTIHQKHQLLTKQIRQIPGQENTPR